MRDLCIVTEGAWPARTGGLATWTQQVLAALEGAEVSVLSLGPAHRSWGDFAVPRHVVEAETVPALRRLPRARVYLASGLAAAAEVLRVRADLRARLRYVEHGDAVRELLAGGAVCEAGLPLRVGDRRRAAAELFAQRQRVASAVGGVVCVTRASARRARREGARAARWIPNAVPPPAAVAARPRAPGRLGFVGRFTRVKGIDRFVRLAARVPGAVAAGLPAGERVRDARAARIEWVIRRESPWQLGIGALAMPSRLEASPFAALEAEARGVPVLLSTAASGLRPSRLVVRLPWCRGRWGRRLDALLRAGLDPAYGAQVARARWSRFVRGWRAFAEG